MRVRLGGSLPIWVDVGAFVLALVGGALVIGSVARSRRAALAGAIGAAVLLTAGAGPLPVLRDGRVAELWFGLFVLETASGALLAQIYKRWILPIVPTEAPASAAPSASE